MCKHRYQQGRASAVPPFGAALGFAFGVFTVALSILATAVVGMS